MTCKFFHDQTLFLCCYSPPWSLQYKNLHRTSISPSWHPNMQINTSLPPSVLSSVTGKPFYSSFNAAQKLPSQHLSSPSIEAPMETLSDIWQFSILGLVMRYDSVLCLKAFLQFLTCRKQAKVAIVWGIRKWTNNKSPIKVLLLKKTDSICSI